MRLEGKVVVLTGAAGGIGSAVAERMAREGASVVLNDIDENRLEALVKRLRADGLVASGCCADVATIEGNTRLMSTALEQHGRIDIFHANAGVAPFEDLLQASAASIEQTITLNLNGAIHGCATVLPTMVRQGGGTILLTASVAAYVGDPTIPAYSATKGGLTALCRSLAVRHGPEGIRCVTICPGDVRTAMLDAYLARDGNPDRARRDMIERYPLRRLAEPSDIAKVAVFLASDDASWITGTDIVVDGGLTARCY